MQGGLVDWHSGEITSPNLASGIACGQTWSPDNGSYPFAWPFISPADYEWVEPDCDHETDLPVAQATCMHVSRTGRLDQRWREGCVDGGHGLFGPRHGCVMSVSIRFAKLGHNDRDGDRLPDR